MKDLKDFLIKGALPVAVGVIVGMLGYEQIKKMTSKTA